MAINDINIGTAPDNGTGDELRTGGQIINDNFKFLDQNKQDYLGAPISDNQMLLFNIDGSWYFTSKGLNEDEVNTILENYIELTQKGAANGVATLDSNGKLIESQIPDLAITKVITATQNTLTDFCDNAGDYEFQDGDVIVIEYSADDVRHFMYKGGAKSVTTNYSQINATRVLISQVEGLQAKLDAFNTRISDLEHKPDPNFIERHPSLSGFPIQGFEDTIYVDESENISYLWDDTDEVYFVLGGGLLEKANLTEIIAGTDDTKYTTSKLIKDWFADKLTKLITFTGNVVFSAGIKISNLAGNGSRIVTADSDGSINGSMETFSPEETDSDIISAAINSTYNEDNNFIANVIPPTGKIFLRGKYFINGLFKYDAINNNQVRRTEVGSFLKSNGDNTQVVLDGGGTKPLSELRGESVVEKDPQQEYYTLVASDANTLILMGTVDKILIPKDVFSAGQVVKIFNNRAGSQLIYAATNDMSVAIKGGSVAEEGNTTWADQKISFGGMITITFFSNNTCHVGGDHQAA